MLVDLFLNDQLVSWMAEYILKIGLKEEMSPVDVEMVYR